MNVKFLSLLNGALAVLVLAACSSSAQASTPEESRRGGFWVFLLFAALATFFWWWLRQSDTTDEAIIAPVKKKSEDGISQSAKVDASPTPLVTAKPARETKPIAPVESQPVAEVDSVISAAAAKTADVVETIAKPLESTKVESAAEKVEDTPVPPAETVTPIANSVSTGDEVIEDPLRAKRLADKQKKAQKKSASGEDDFTVVEGIGPKINGLLHDAGIKTYNQLGNTSVETLREILVKNSLQYHDPGTWAEQSSLAAAEQWDDLEKLQSTLSGGKRK